MFAESGLDRVEVAGEQESRRNECLSSLLLFLLLFFMVFGGSVSEGPTRKREPNPLRHGAVEHC